MGGFYSKMYSTSMTHLVYCTSAALYIVGTLVDMHNLSWHSLFYYEYKFSYLIKKKSKISFLSSI